MATAFKADFLAEPTIEVPALEVVARPLPSLESLPPKCEAHMQSQTDNLFELGFDQEVTATVCDPTPDFFADRESTVFRPLYVVEMTLVSGVRAGETFPILTHMLTGQQFLKLRSAVKSGEPVRINLLVRRFHTSALLVATTIE